MGYLERLRAINEENTHQAGTDKTDENHLVSLGSSPLAHENIIFSLWWLLHFPEREPVQVWTAPPASHAEILERHPAAIAAEPCAPPLSKAEKCMEADDVGAITEWVEAVGGDADDLAIVLRQCDEDVEARVYYIREAGATADKYEPIGQGA